MYKLNKEERKIVTLTALGGMLEFYDFIIYGIFSVYFAQQFFPGHDSILAVIKSYVIFIFGGLAPVIISSFIKAGYNIHLTPMIYLLIIVGVCAAGVSAIVFGNKIIFQHAMIV